MNASGLLFPSSRWTFPLTTDIQISLLGQRLFADTGDSNEWFFLHPGGAHDYGFYVVGLTIANWGDAKTGDLLLTITANKECLPDPDGISKRTLNPRVLKDQFKVATAKIGNFRQASYVLPSIAPHGAIIIEELFLFQPTFQLSKTLRATTKDGIEISAEVEFSLSHVFTFVVMSPDQPANSQSVKITCIEAKNFDEATHRIANAFSARLQARLNELGRVTRYMQRFKPAVPTTYRMAEIAPLKSLVVDKRTVHVFGGTEDSRATVRVLKLYAARGLLTE